MEAVSQGGEVNREKIYKIAWEAYCDTKEKETHGDIVNRIIDALIREGSVEVEEEK